MPELRIKGFLGLYTRADRGQKPLGALEGVENLMFNKVIGQGALRTGYSADLSGSIADFQATTTITSYRFPRGTHPATEAPSSQNIRILCGTDGSSGTHYFVKPFWHKNNATIESTSWLRLSESFQTTMSAKSTNSFDLDSLPAWDGVDRYNGMIVRNVTAGDEELYITDSVSGNVTTLEDLPSDWANGDTVVLYRHFHDNPTFAIGWTDPVAVKIGNNFIVSGGQNSNTGRKPVEFLPSINKTYFSGASRTPSYNQSYACEFELKNDGSGVEPQTPANYTPTVPIDPSSASRAFMYFITETDDGLRGLPIGAATPYDPITIAEGIQSEIQINFPRLDKRIRYIHVFVGIDLTSSRTTLEYDELFFIETLDLTGTGWTYQNSTTVPGYFNRTVQVDGVKWSARGEDLATFLGHTEPTRTTVSFSHGLIAAGRLFVAKYYDYAASLSFNDQINYSPFASNGVAQYNKLLDLDDQTQTTVQAGDPSEIEGLAELDGKLFIPKTRGVYFFDITADPTLWFLQTVTREIGCDAQDSLVVTPQGVIWAKSGDGVYLWRGGDPIELSANWRDTFRALTAGSVTSWWGWYDPYTRGYRLMYTSDGSTKTTVYECHLDTRLENGPPIWTKHVVAHNIGQVTTRSDGVVFFSTGAAATYSFSSSATDDAGTQIRPYFKLGEYSVTEDELAQFERWSLSVTQTGTPEVGRELDLKVYVDGSQLKEYANVTSTNSRFAVDLPILGTSNRNRVGKTVDFEFNSDSTRRGLGTAYAIHELVIYYSLLKYAGTSRKSL